MDELIGEIETDMDKLISEMESEKTKYLQLYKKSCGWETHYYSGQASAYTKIVVSLKILKEKMKLDNTLIELNNCQN